ncbi:MAG: SDR family oxidoreductase [Archangium sp.]|nr:SDR family oxidoreductase [Archangium sp.]
MRVLVTGASGLVGSRLIKLLSSAGHTAIGLDRSGSELAVDMVNAAAFTDALSAAKPDAIINCAAMTDVDGCEREPSAAWAVNAEAPATLARYVRTHDCHLVHLSSDYVFDGDRGGYRPDDVPNPRGIYAITKHGGEQAIRAVAPKERFAIARPAVVYGWPAVAGKNNFGSWLVDALGSGKPVKLFSDQWVSPTHALNAAEMAAELATRRLPGIWHIAGAEVVDRVTFGHRLCERFGFDRALVQPSRMADVNLPSPRPAKSGLDVSRTSESLTARPWSLEAALDRLHAEVKGKS